MIRDIAQLTTLENECNFCLEACNVCQRSGLPILPLRRALVPKEPVWPEVATELPDTQLGLRTLRAGYLYVLLDQKVWQAYEVMADGYLRQIDPYRRRAASYNVLSSTCIHGDHDIPASFLNIDTARYSTADIAFSGDPWPRSVLDAYKAGTGFARLQRLDLATARNDPAATGLAMTGDQPQVLEHVYEYRDFVPGFTSVHGFHSRADRRMPLRQYLRDGMARHNLAHGLVAVIIDDTVGLVQEYNGLRASWAHARQYWLEEPERAYQQQTSQILLTIRELNRQWAEPKVPRHRPMSKQPYPHIVPWATERQRLVDALVNESNERLEERYDEPRRAAFQAAYDQQLQDYQQQIDRYAALYAAAFGSAKFALIQQHDYAANDLNCAIAYAKMLSLCLRGGISEAPGNADGPTAQLWLKLLQDPKGPVYQALLLRDQNLLSCLLPIFEIDGPIDWQDSNRLYTLLTKTLLSKEAEKLRRAHLQEAIAQLLAAMNSAGARLKELLGPGVELAISRLNSASQLLYNGVHLTELRVQMKLSEYYALQSAHIRSLQHKLANGADRAVKRTREKVEPLIMGGVLSLSVLDPKLAHLVVGVSVWVEGTLEDLKSSLAQDARPASNHGLVSSRELLPVAVEVGTLDMQTRKLLQGFEVSSQLAGRWVRGGFAGLRGIAGSADLLISVGSLYLLNDSLGKNLKAAEKVIGDKAPEAVLALQGSMLGVFGGGVELVGLAIRDGGPAITRSLLPSTQAADLAKEYAKIGSRFAMAGGVIMALTGLHDAAIANIAGDRATRNGDEFASKVYRISTLPTVGGAFFGVAAAFAASIFLWGFLGIALALSLLGYSLSKLGQNQESTPLERWARRSFFGNANETPKVHWKSSAQANSAISELNAITLGVNAAVEFHRDGTLTSGVHAGGLRAYESMEIKYEWKYKLRYHFSLPHYDEIRSALRWSLRAHRGKEKLKDWYEGGEIIAQGMLNDLNQGLESEVWGRSILNTETHNTAKPLATPSVAKRTVSQENRDALALTDFFEEFDILPPTGNDYIEAATLTLIYWPDLSSENAFATITCTAVRS
ncbi:T6SS effector BTH_I2691 family protein [Pseudomonas sp. HR96]|uniref:T6SS effector BTH_I2691 family protein n=1 Tax=Pseudomonas sp. HR96 TaxID=1027966 RepID=UPI002A74C51F|nr:T6SS effector BTH_I2691 family protein [Pseudomonas sp. HR96]WPP01760.1 T6SS effector BTH_I2691 family protein [Pseudomonas sp. HR96]